MPHEMRRRTAEAHPPRHRPGCAAVVGESLHDRERRHAGASDSFLDPDRGDEPARGQLDDVRLVVVGRRRPRCHRHAADDPPGLAAVARAGGGDLADFHVLPGAEGFAEVEQVAVGELDRAVGRGHRRPAGVTPGLAAVVGDTRPRADEPGDHVVGPVGKHLRPRIPLGGRNPSFLGIDPRVAAKPRGEDRLPAEVYDSSVAVVDRRVLDHPRRRPGAAVVAADIEHGLAERADMLGPQAGTHDQQRAVIHAGNGGPGEVAEPLAGQAVDHALFRIEHAGSRLRGLGGKGHEQGDGSPGPQCGSFAAATRAGDPIPRLSPGAFIRVRCHGLSKPGVEAMGPVL